MSDLIDRPGKTGKFGTDKNVPSNDCISRQAAIDMFQNLANDDWNKDTSTTWANAFAESADMIEDLPAAQPQRMRGKWITMAFMTAECSACHVQLHGMECANFCPSCGADMREGQDETD